MSVATPSNPLSGFFCVVIGTSQDPGHLPRLKQQQQLLIYSSQLAANKQTQSITQSPLEQKLIPLGCCTMVWVMDVQKRVKSKRKIDRGEEVSVTLSWLRKVWIRSLNDKHLSWRTSLLTQEERPCEDEMITQNKTTYRGCDTQLTYYSVLSVTFPAELGLNKLLHLQLMQNKHFKKQPVSFLNWDNFI